MKWVWGLAVILAVTGIPEPVTAQIHAGAAAVEITPALCADAKPDARPVQFDVDRQCFRWIHLGGFSPYIPFRQDSRLATGIHDPLWARSLALRSATGSTLVIVSTDLPGLGRKHIGRIQRRVAATHGVPADHVIIHSTHTHSAPDASGYWSTLMTGHNDRYVTQVREHIYSSITTALNALQPAHLRTATTSHVSCRDQQTGLLKKEPDCNLPDINNMVDIPTVQYDSFILQRDLRDPIVRNTRIVAAELTASATGETIATLVNWHNHPDTLGSANRLISSDYPHYLREYLDRTRGGITVFVAGTVGNQMSGLRGTPVPLWDEQGNRVLESQNDDTTIPVLVTEGWDKIRSTGYEIAYEAAVALDAASPVARPDIAVSVAHIDTPISNALHLFGTWSVWHHDVEATERLRYRWPDCIGLLGCTRATVALLEIGDLSVLTAPGEIDPAYALGRRATTADYGPVWGTWHFPAMAGVDYLMPGKHHAFMGSSQDYLSYMVPVADNVGWWNFDHPNHYEEWVTIGKGFGDEVATAWQQLLNAPITISSP